MKRHSKHAIYNPYADINVVPLVDLTFNLLIIFMLATPLLESSINVKLPPAQSGEINQEAASRVISINSKGVIYLDDVPVSLDALRPQIENAVSRNPDVPILVRADQEIAYREFVQVVDLLKLSGVKKMGIVTARE